MRVAAAAVDLFPTGPQSLGGFLFQPSRMGQHAAGRCVVAEEPRSVLLGSQAQADRLTGEPDLAVPGDAVANRFDVQHPVG